MYYLLNTTSAINSTRIATRTRTLNGHRESLVINTSCEILSVFATQFMRYFSARAALKIQIQKAKQQQ